MRTVGDGRVQIPTGISRIYILNKSKKECIFLRLICRCFSFSSELNWEVRYVPYCFFYNSQKLRIALTMYGNYLQKECNRRKSRHIGISYLTYKIILVLFVL